MNSEEWHLPNRESAAISRTETPRVWGRVVWIMVCLLAGALLWGTTWVVDQQRTSEPLAEDLPVTVPRGLPQVGQPAPDFTLTSLQHGEQSLARWRGQPVLINFWATWCGPCRREMPELVAAHERYQAEGLVILAVNLSHQDVHAQVEAFAEEYQVPFPLLLDVTGEVADKVYGARGLPMSVFIDREGNVQHIYLGALNHEWLDQLVAEIL